MTTAPSFLTLHLRVVGALFRREMVTRYGRTAGGYFWAIGEPVAFIVLLTLIFSQLSRLPALGNSFALFFASGFLAFSFYRTISDILGPAITANRALLNFPRVTPYDALIARFVLQTLTNVIVFVVIFGGMHFLLEVPDHFNFVYAGLGFGLASLLGLGIGAVNSVAFVLSPLWERLFAIINRPLFIISGVFFTPESLPPQARDLLLINPIVHIVGIFRKAFYPTYDAAYISYFYVASWIMITIFLGVYLVTKHRYTLAEQ